VTIWNLAERTTTPRKPRGFTSSSQALPDQPPDRISHRRKAREEQRYRSPELALMPACR
jgi:hypothetical protein